VPHALGAAHPTGAGYVIPGRVRGRDRRFCERFYCLLDPVFDLFAKRLALSQTGVRVPFEGSDSIITMIVCWNAICGHDVPRRVPGRPDSRFSECVYLPLDHLLGRTSLTEVVG
jgi:hypothetical protein